MLLLSLFFAVNYRAYIAVQQVPGGIKHQLRAFGQQREVNLANLVAGTVVISVYTVKVEDDRHAMFGKIVMVRTGIEAVRVVQIIILIIQYQVSVSFIGVLVYIMQVGAQ